MSFPRWEGWVIINEGHRVDFKSIRNVLFLILCGGLKCLCMALTEKLMG